MNAEKKERPRTRDRDATCTCSSSAGDLEGFLDTVNFAAAEANVPAVMTTSYARGVSILFATGDSGVGAGDPNTNCSSQFISQFPAGCPFVTAVGASTGGVPEIAANLSSGGFSNYFSMPDYQATAVAGYPDNLGDTYDGLFNVSGRAFPDISDYGESVVIFNSSQPTEVDGTSCSTPIFASVIALINDQLMAAGQPPLGFLNPWLYSNASLALNDITNGSNPGCGTDGFPATVGWDPVTGPGSPNFNALLAAAGLGSL